MAPRPPTDPNGRRGPLYAGPLVPALADEGTGQHNVITLARDGAAADLQASSSEGADPIAQLAELLGAKIGDGNGGGGGGAPFDLKKVHRRNWMVNTLIALTVAGSGTFAAYKATESRSLANEKANAEQSEVIDQHTEAIRYIKVEVKETGQKVDRAMIQQRAIVDGIDQLKEEAQTDKQKRLEETVKRLERENRRLERRGR
jgi:hypothetical protein